MEISIIVPAFNIGEEVCYCLDSLVNQTLPDNQYEIIVVDDRSTDNTFDVLREYAQRYRNIRLLQTMVNSGAGGAYNEGLRHCMGQWIMFVDQDDFIELEACEKLLNFSKDTAADVIGFGYGVTEKHSFNSDLRQTIPFSNELIGPVDTLQKKKRLYQTFASTWVRIYRRTVLINENSLGGCFPEMTTYEDFPVMGDILVMNCRHFDIFPQTLYHYYHNTKSVSHSGFSEAKLQDIRRGTRLYIKLAMLHGYFDEFYDVISSSTAWITWYAIFNCIFGLMRISQGQKYCRALYQELCQFFPDFRDSCYYNDSINAATQKFFDLLGEGKQSWRFQFTYLKWHMYGLARNSTLLNCVYRNSSGLKKIYRRIAGNLQ